MDKEQFDRENIFGIGVPNVDYVSIMQNILLEISYLNPLVDPKSSPFLFRLCTFENCYNQKFNKNSFLLTK